MIDGMDERKKQIEELERHKREEAAVLDSRLERLGESLCGRMEDGAASPHLPGDYHRLRKDIADSEAAIKTIEEQIRRLRELEETIADKEQEESERAKSLASLYGRLGTVIVEDESGMYGEQSRSDDITPFREQAGPLFDKVRSLEDRVAELERSERGNVFAWIGKGAQSLVLRSFLTKAQENLEHIYRSAGERYSRRDMPPSECAPVIAPLIAGIAEMKERSRALSGDMAALREERRAIGNGFNAEGGPLKHIQALKSHIGRTREELRNLYRRFGDEASSLIPAEGGAPRSPEGNERGRFIESLLTPDDRALLDDAARLRQGIRDDERAMEKLRSSLAIDDERAKIEKCRGLIADAKKRIARAEAEIAEFEENITDSENYIAELQKLL